MKGPRGASTAVNGADETAYVQAKTPRVGVLALQGAVAEHAKLLKGLGAHVSLVRTADDLDAVDGLIIPGGESTAMARLAAGTGLFAAIRSRIDGGTLAVFGTCAGLILLSDDVAPAGSLRETIGGLPVSVTRNGFGNQLASFEAELDLADSSSDIESGSDATKVGSESQGITATTKTDEITPTSGSCSQTFHSAAPRTRHLRAAFIRAPRITEVGEEVRVLASYEGEAVVVEYGKLIAATCHPEITGDATLHARFLNLVP